MAPSRFGSVCSVGSTLAALALTSWLASGCGLPETDLLLFDDELVEYEDELQLARFGLAVDVDPAISSFGAADDVVAKVTFRNGGTGVLRLLLWALPESADEAELFSVSRGGEELAFRGRHYKYPTAASVYLLPLGPGETVTRQMNLSQVFEFSQTGEYQVAYQAKSFEVVVDGQRRVGSLRSAERTFLVEGRPFAAPVLGDPKRPGGGGAGVAQCTTAQQAEISKALAASATMAHDSMSYLSGGLRGSTRYATWFGAATTARWDLATAHFQSIASAFQSQPVTVDCSCTGSYFAYVYPDSPYRIFVCGAFWSAPLTGTDSKAGTLVHEMSHFTVVASTEDYAYGHKTCARLARKNPERAVRNADSHEYFAENTPPLQ